MYFHTNECVYLTYFNNEVIALDLRKDQYLLLSEFLSNVIYLALNNEFKHVLDRYVLRDNEELRLPDDFDATIEHLREIGILSKDDFNDPDVRPLKKVGFSAGAPNVDWRMSSSNPDLKNVSSRILRQGTPMIVGY